MDVLKFLLARSEAVTTSVKVGDVVIRLDGNPTALTNEALARLAAQAETVAWSETSGSVHVRGRCSGKAAARAIRRKVGDVAQFLAARSQTVHGRFPLAERLTARELLVREWLIHAWAGGYTTAAAEAVEGLIGPDDDEGQDCVSIPFVLRTGEWVALYGGWIHATDRITWDMLPTGADNLLPAWVDERFPCLDCSPTVEFVRALRVL